MKRTIVAIALLVCCCSAPKKEEVHFELINSKTETEGTNANRMDLYAPTKDLDKESLVKLCTEQKQNWREGTFYYLVVFDQSDNATFPNNPFTSLYGIDEEPQKHILALYEYNRINGFSQLTYYSSNMREGKAVTEAID